MSCRKLSTPLLKLRGFKGGRSWRVDIWMCQCWFLMLCFSISIFLPRHYNLWLHSFPHRIHWSWGYCIFNGKHSQNQNKPKIVLPFTQDYVYHQNKSRKYFVQLGRGAQGAELKARGCNLELIGVMKEWTRLSPPLKEGDQSLNIP